MTFPSYTFAIFFAVMLLLQRAPFSWPTRKGFLLVGSYVFYAAWNPPFVFLLWLSTVVDWMLARRIHDENRAAQRRFYLFLSLATNLGLLSFFKYGGFVADNFSTVVAALGSDWEMAAPSVVLPVGISFYTFQTLSYTVDVYRRRLTPSDSFLDYALYVTFFPQLVAGPIVRAGHFLPQCRAPAKRVSSDQLAWGMSLLILGLFQKVVLADALLSPVVDKLYGSTAASSFTDAWLGTIAFAGQIFCDFSGYSTCAIGVALALGFHLPDNFRAPYAAIGFSDFWRRWHISLSSWLRDYLYIPLGGSLHGALRTAIALSCTMLLGGLWHGASWTFVAWGALHGGYLVLERGLRAAIKVAPWQRLLPTRFVLGAITFALVNVAWVFFRAESFEQAFVIVKAMFGLGAGTDLLAGWQRVLVLAVMGPLLLLQTLLRERSFENIVQRTPWWVRGVVLAFFLLAIFVSPGQDRAFIYFQF